MPHDHTARLPPELLQHVANDLTLIELLPLLATSRRWREIAINARAYRGSIELTVASNGAANLFLTRLARTYARPFSLAIHIKTDWSDLERTIPALRAHLHHITRLDLQVHVAQTGAILAAICTAADLLEMFHFASSTDPFDAQPVHSPFPSELFGGHAPSLQNVSFCNMVLPGEPPVRAFRTVWGLGLAYYTVPVTAAPNIFPHFPNLRELRIRGFFNLLHPAFLLPSSWAAVDVVRFDLEGTAAVVEIDLLPLSGIPFVEIKFPSRMHIHPLLSHVCGRVGLSIYDWGADDLLIYLVDADRSRTRAMLKPKLWMESEDPASFRFDLFTLPDIAHRVFSLTLDCWLWDVLVSIIPELPLVETVKLVFKQDIPPLRAVLECPRLARLVFQSIVGYWRRVPVRMFMDFASVSLRGVRFPIEMGLDNVELDFKDNDGDTVNDFREFFSLVPEL